MGKLSVSNFFFACCFPDVIFICETIIRIGKKENDEEKGICCIWSIIYVTRSFSVSDVRIFDLIARKKASFRPNKKRND